MKIKVGQWFRSGDTLYHYNEDESGILPNYMIIANTPQELIQVGDLVETDIYPLLPVTEVLNDLHINCYCEKFIRVKDGCDIIKIYTPNEDKSVYTLQWEIKKEDSQWVKDKIIETMGLESF